MENVFPYKENIDYSKLRLSDEGEYSITKKKDAESILAFMTSILTTTQDKTITDATACNGGDTINFAMHFKTVLSVELKKTNYEVLVNNVNTFQLTNVRTYCGDITKMYHWNTNVLYVDPPWGGPNYRQFKELDLFVGDVRLDVWVSSVLERENRPGYIFLKLPFNYNFNRLHFLPNVAKMVSYRVRAPLIIIGIVVSLV